MADKVLVNEKDLRIEYKRDGGNLNVGACIVALSKTLWDSNTVTTVLDYLYYLENKLVEKYNEIDYLLENDDYKSLKNDYDALVDDYIEVNKERIDVIFKKIEYKKENAILQSKLKELESENENLKNQLIELRER